MDIIIQQVYRRLYDKAEPIPQIKVGSHLVSCEFKACRPVSISQTTSALLESAGEPGVISYMEKFLQFIFVILFAKNYVYAAKGA